MEDVFKYIVMSASLFIIVFMIATYVTTEDPIIYKTEAVLEVIEDTFNMSFIGEYTKLLHDFPNRVKENKSNLVDNLNLGIFNVLKPILTVIVVGLSGIDFMKDLIVYTWELMWSPFLLIWNILTMEHVEEARAIQMFNYVYAK